MRGFSVVIAGGGVAGLEAALALRDLAGERVTTTLVSPDAEFVYRPMAVAEPFGRGRPARHRLAEIARDLGVELVGDAISEIRSERRRVVTQGDREVGYDALLVAVGARSEPALRGALTWTPESDSDVYAGVLADIEEGYTKRVGFVVPPGVAWALPAYELALMTAWQAWTMGQDDVESTIYTHEQAPLGLFGARASAAVREDLKEAGVRVETGVLVGDDPDRLGRLVLHPGGRRLTAERIVALPRARGLALQGLPADARGFLLTDLHGRVAGVDRVWAAGDAIAFPVKQGGLAAQQADAAAESIAAVAGVEIDPRPFRPVLRGMMLTGRRREWMRNDGSPGAGEGDASRRALWWPPTKIAGHYLSPYLTTHGQSDVIDAAPLPAGRRVQLDLARDLPAAADALKQAGRRGSAQAFGRLAASVRATSEPTTWPPEAP